VDNCIAETARDNGSKNEIHVEQERDHVELPRAVDGADRYYQAENREYTLCEKGVIETPPSDKGH
jgi:hypothetical protein